MTKKQGAASREGGSVGKKITSSCLPTTSEIATSTGAALRGDVRPTTRPDIDNYVKATMDAINEIVIADDALVVTLMAFKRYASVPQLTIEIMPLPAATAQVRR